MNTKHFAAMAISTALLSMVGGCTDRLEDAGIPVGNTVITASMDDAQGATRSAIDPTEYIGGQVGILWTPEDCLGVFGSADSNVPFRNMSTTPMGRTQFTGNMTNGAPLYAYYPYSEENNGAEVTALKGTLPLVQPYDRLTGVLTGDYKYGTPREDAENEFNFRHLFSLLHFSVSLSGTSMESETLKKVKLTLPEGRVLGGDFTFNAITGEYTFAEAAGKANTVTMKVEGSPVLGSSNTYQGYVSCAPDMKADDEITIQVYTDKHVASFTKHIAYNFEPNAVYHFDLALSGYGSDVTITDAPAEPEFTSFSFTVAANKGKILDKKVVSANSGASASENNVTEEAMTIEGLNINGMIPYLYDFSLVPTFTVPNGVKVLVNGVEQESGVTAQDFSKPVVYTLVSGDEQVEYTVNVTNTGLPVVVINQSSTLTTGTWNKWFGSLSLRSKDSDWVEDDKITIYDVNGKYVMSEQTAGIRLRGNSTQSFPKKPLAIKLAAKQAIGDMPKHKRWVLLANWLDNSMVRNNTAFAIAHATEAAWRAGSIEQGLPWNVHGINVELVIDGRHVGNYYLCEQIKIDKNRLAIKDAYEDVVKDGVVAATFANCGYLIECDDNYDENYKFLTAKRYLPFQLKDDVTSDILSQIQTKVNRIEANIIAGNYSAAYEELDINSLIDQWIVFELTMNDEYKHPKSVYMYMDGGDSKLCAGPVWDFDYQTFPNNQKIATLSTLYGGVSSAPSMTAWLYSESSPATSAQEKNESDMPYMWYPLLFKDATFRAAVQTRWAAIYPHLLGVVAEIQKQKDLNAKSWAVNHAMWPLNFDRRAVVSWGPALSGDEDFATYQEVIDNLTEMYNQRLDWMNSAITSGNFVTNGK